jgi:hypothetical protein
MSKVQHYIERMDHILMSCIAEPVTIIWNLAQETWPHTPELWPNINLGMILASRILSTPKEEEGEQSEQVDNDHEKAQKRMDKKGRDRLLQILILESTHLIWVLRCKKIINECLHTPGEISSRWL